MKAVIVGLIIVVAGCAPVHERPTDGGHLNGADAEDKSSPARDGYSLDMEGQLRRAHFVRGDSKFDDATSSQLAWWAKHGADIPRLRELTASPSSTVDPRSYMWVCAKAESWVGVNGGLTYEMLEKNSDRYAGVAWFIMSAKILEIFEEGRHSVARVEMDPGAHHPIAVEWDYLTNFVAGDKVDIVGFWSGSFDYKARIGNVTIPGMAAVGVFKPGTIQAMNRLVKVWLGNVGPDQLRNVPRKI